MEKMAIEKHSEKSPRLKRTNIIEVPDRVGEKVLLKAWVQTRRDQGGIKFLILRDITGIIQAVTTKKNAESFKKCEELSTESVVSVVGLAKKEAQAPGGIEVFIESIEILSRAEPELPIQVMEKGGDEAALNKRLDWRFIDLRKPENALIFKTWTTMENAFRKFCISHNYIEIHSPKTLITSTESGSELFEIKYFTKKAFLAQSPQLYKQMAMAAGLEKVFEVGPVFRANPSFTSRHDTEFTMYDVEMSFIDSHHDLMREEEKMIIAMFRDIKKKHGDEIKEKYSEEITVPKSGFPKLTFREAKKILQELGIPSDKKNDLSPEEERAISQYIKERKGHEFLFIHEWPTEARAFYTMRSEKDPTVTKSFDLLYRGLEITSGAQREHRHDRLKQQILEKGFKLGPFNEYLNFFKYGVPPHGGFAPGPTRILMKMLGLNNVREATYIYRGPNRLTP